MNNKTGKFIIPALVIAAAAFFALRTREEPAPGTRQVTRLMMGTYFSIQVPEGEADSRKINRAFDRVHEIYSKFSVYDPESPVSKFNEQGRAIADPEIIRLVETSIEVSEASRGAFDITVYPVLKLWGFYSEERRLPARREIEQALRRVGSDRLRIVRGSLLPGEYGIDFGAIAKGYAVDEAAKVLRSEGVNNALIDAGGDMFAMGENAGKPWRIGIRNPPGEGLVGVMKVSGGAVATSGDYERYFEVDGRKYHHIMDPRTGYPAPGTVSVTVSAPTAELADAWSTALYVMGVDEALEAVEKLDSIEALVMSADGSRMASSGFAMEPQ